MKPLYHPNWSRELPLPGPLSQAGCAAGNTHTGEGREPDPRKQNPI
jgi:hypothetical protein